MNKILTSSLIKIITVGIFSVIVFLVLLRLFFANINTLFNITAHTEIVAFQTAKKPISRYNLNNASVYVTDDFSFKNIYTSFNGSLELNKDVHVKIERMSQGSIILELEGLNEEPIGNLYDSNNAQVYTATDYMLIEIHKVDSLLNSGKSIVFPLSGFVELGKSVDVEIYDETSPVLRTGDITMTGYTNFGGGKYFEAGSEKLYLGDRLEFKNAEAIGFVAVNDNPALQVSYRIEAEEAVIIKPGPKSNNSGYRISASIYDRFINDQLFQGISLIFASLIAIMSLLDFGFKMVKPIKII